MRKPGLLFLALIYTATNAVLVHAEETNVWQERRAEGRPDRSPAPSLARALLSEGNHLLPPTPRALDRLGTSGVALGSGLPARLIAAIPAGAGTVRDVHLERSDRPFVLVVQDVHLNKEAQRNIARIISQVRTADAAARRSPFVVGIEGASGAFDFSPLRQSQDVRARTALADQFLSEDRLAAPGYLGVTSPEAPFVVGIDDAPHYAANVAAVRRAMPLRDAAVRTIEQSRIRVSLEKANTFRGPLQRFDADWTAYLDGRLGLGDYAARLARHAVGAGLAPDAVLRRFLLAFEMESSLDLGKVESERADVIGRLANRLTEADLRSLAATAEDYRSGRLSFPNYYRHIQNLIERHHVSLARAPSFERYMRYVLLADGIVPTDLTASMDRLEAATLARLATTADERRLIRATRRLHLLRNLVQFSLTMEEWREYREAGADPASTPDLAPEVLSVFESFYREADSRSDRMAENLLSRVPRAGIALVGGFHTDRLTALLRQRGVAYAVVQPKLTRIDGTGTDYLSVFFREKSPLDRLFAGERLFLAPAVPALFGAASTDDPSVKANEFLFQNVLRAQEALARGGDPVQVEVEGRTAVFSGTPRPDLEQRGYTRVYVHNPPGSATPIYVHLESAAPREEPTRVGWAALNAAVPALRLELSPELQAMAREFLQGPSLRARLSARIRGLFSMIRAGPFRVGPLRTLFFTPNGLARGPVGRWLALRRYQAALNEFVERVGRLTTVGGRPVNVAVVALGGSWGVGPRIGLYDGAMTAKRAHEIQLIKRYEPARANAALFGGPNPYEFPSDLDFQISIKAGPLEDLFPVWNQVNVVADEIFEKHGVLIDTSVQAYPGAVPIDRVLGSGLRTLPAVTGRTGNAPLALTNEATMRAWMGFFSRYLPLLNNWVGAAAVMLLVSFWWESPQTLDRGRFSASHFEGTGPWVYADTPGNRSSVRRRADAIMAGMLWGAVAGSIAAVAFFLTAHPDAAWFVSGLLGTTFAAGAMGAIAGNFGTHFVLNLPAVARFVGLVRRRQAAVERLVADRRLAPGEALYARSRVSVAPVAFVLNRVWPVVRLGVGQSQAVVGDPALLSSGDVAALAMLADGRRPIVDSAESGRRLSGPDVTAEAELVVLDAADPDFSRKAAAVQARASTGAAVLVHAPGLSPAQAASLGSVAFLDDLSAGAVTEAAAARRWAIEKLQVRFFSKTPAAFNPDVAARIDLLKSRFSVSLELAVLLANVVVSVPVTKGELDRMFELERQLNQLIGSQA